MQILSNPMLIFWGAVVVMAVVPTYLYYWNKSKREAMDADLKMKMLEMGMSAPDIERVLRAESQSSGEDTVKSMLEMGHSPKEVKQMLDAERRSRACAR